MAETIPGDIAGNIFSRLPIKFILQCKRVCKPWRAIIGKTVGLVFTFYTRDYVTQLYYGDPEYETKIEKYYSEKTLTPIPLIPRDREVLLKPSGMVGSCNGLVCFKVENPIYSEDDFAFICTNPMTGEVADIPGLENQGPSLGTDPVGGFGYVCSTNEYKVVRIYYKYWGAYAQVYTLGSHLGWRDKGNVFTVFSTKESGIFANEALHWIDRRTYELGQIVAFGLVDEEFWPIPSPPCSDWQYSNSNSKLILLGGNLCLVHTNRQSINKRLDIWAFKRSVMTNDISTSYGKVKGKRRGYYYYDQTWNWSLEYSIAWEGQVLYTPFIITKQNTVLLWKNGTSNLCCYDPKTSTLQKYSDGEEGDKGYVQAIPHMNSLVSLKEIGEIS
ncbi:F-box protein At3g07870-like [Papaver somniferum]|uniref:F-box protein At3g07870-like n=1 Tax=Papaver somniferum TaxID=3469 RepID=UPI000E6FCD2B|nr:F-box protein At3g07870-like [Papaver somniferum]